MMRRYALVNIVLVLGGCGRSPARAPVKLVRVPVEQAVVVPSCDDDEIADEEELGMRAKGVEYVPIDEWEPPPSVRRIEAKIRARGPGGPPAPSPMPPLTLHRPIPETRVYGLSRGRYYR
jgi:hypothetical protein